MLHTGMLQDSCGMSDVAEFGNDALLDSTQLDAGELKNFAVARGRVGYDGGKDKVGFVLSETSPNSDDPKLAVLKGHDAWARLAVAPDGITFAREEQNLSVEEFRNVIMGSGSNREVNDTSRLARMLAHANLLITARDSSNRLVGVARSLTDFAFCCYLSDLYVEKSYQGRGIGRTLIAETKRIVGPDSMVLLLSTPKPLSYYPRIGMAKAENAYIIRRDN